MNDFGLLEPAQKLANHGVMPLDQGDAFPIAQLLFQLGGADDVSEEQSEKPEAMPALELPVTLFWINGQVHGL